MDEHIAGLELSDTSHELIGLAIARELLLNWQNDEDVIASFWSVATIAYMEGMIATSMDTDVTLPGPDESTPY